MELNNSLELKLKLHKLVAELVTPQQNEENIHFCLKSFITIASQRGKAYDQYC